MNDLIPTPQDALILIDIQNDFLPGGSLAVPDGDAILPVVHRLIQRFDTVIATQDWHPVDHQSFASNHPGKAPFETTELHYGPQVLWPDHCIAGGPGADLCLEDASLDRIQHLVRKGFRSGMNSYSAFLENDRATPTGLAGTLRERGITRLFFVGLATDYCVAYSALDAIALGFEAVVLLDGCRGIAPDSTMQKIGEMTAAGVNVVPVASGL